MNKSATARYRRRGGALMSGAALASAVCVLAACSSSGSSSAGATQSASASASAQGTSAPSKASGTPIKLGMAGAETGGEAVVGASGIAATRAWVDYTNAHGGASGHPIELFTADTQSNPAAGLAAAETLVQNDGVAAMLVFDPASEGGIGAYLAQQKIPLLGVGYSASVYGAGTGSPSGAAGLPNVFAPNTSQLATNIGVVIGAKAVKATTVGVALCTASPACAQATPLFASQVPANGMKWTGSVDTATAQPPYTAQCVHFTSTNTDYIALVSDAVSAELIANSCLQQGFKGTFGIQSGTVSLTELAKAAGATFVGDIQGFPWWIDNPLVTPYRSAMAEYEPGAEYRSGAGTAAWASLLLMTKAISNAKLGATAQVTASALTQAYGTIKGETLGGLLPAPVTYTSGVAATEPNCLWLFKYQAGAANPTTLPAQGTPGNGVTGDLASTCVQLAK